MSQPEQQRQRSNFYSSAGGDYEPDREPLDDSKPTHQRATSSSSNKDEWIAFGILLDGATRTCPNCFEDHDPDDEVGEEPLGVVLADKELAPRECEGRKTVTPATALKWTCPECGYQCFGGILGDRTIPEFLDVVDEVLGLDGVILEGDVVAEVGREVGAGDVAGGDVGTHSVRPPSDRSRSLSDKSSLYTSR